MSKKSSISKNEPEKAMTDIEKSKSEKPQLSEAFKRKLLLRRISVIVLTVLAVLIALCLAGKIILEKLIGEKEPVVQVDEVYKTYNFYDVPEKDLWPEIDISSDGEYMSLDRGIHIKSDSLGGTFVLDDIPKEMRTEAHRFFDVYFGMMKEGNYPLYPSLFSDRYKEKMTGFEKNINREFPPQMVYDILVTEHARVTGQVIDGKECTIGIYQVDYKIFKNDGLFRNDIGRDIDMGKDVSHPLLFELITFGAGTDFEKTYINNLYTESSITAASGN